METKRPVWSPWAAAMAGTILLATCGVTAGCTSLESPSSPSPQQARVVSENVDAEILRELNRARTNPAAYAELVADRLDGYDGREGKRAIREAIRVLRRTRPMPPLEASRQVAFAARDHVIDQGRSGRTGHSGSDGSNPFDRMSRYVVTHGAAENIAYGIYDARDIVVELLIDDGVPSRGHRDNILNPNYTHVGIATSPHADYGFMCVMDFTYPYEVVGAAATN